MNGTQALPSRNPWPQLSAAMVAEEKLSPSFPSCAISNFGESLYYLWEDSTKIITALTLTRHSLSVRVDSWNVVQNHAAALEDSLAVPRNVKQRVNLGTSNSTPRHIPTKKKKKNLFSDVYSNSIHNSQKAGEWINEMWSNHTMEYFSTLKIHEILIHIIT